MSRSIQSIITVIIIVLVAAGIYMYTHKSVQAPMQQACTMEAKLCPDGSYVGRSGPNCEFAACPNDIGATSTSASVPPAAASSTAWESQFKTVSQADQNTTVTLVKGERFIIKFGDTLNWTFAFSPVGSISRVANSTTADGIQGIYEADLAGDATLTATGAPICKAGEMCAQFLQSVTIHFAIK